MSSRQPAAALALAAILTALFWSIRWAVAADPQSAATQIELARDLLPGPNPAIMAHVEQALRLTPTNPNYWIDCADIAEQLHDLARAHSCLEHAVAIDRTFAPRWLLAEFYARRHDPRFWPAMRTALAASYDDDLAPLFDECWSFTSDPAEILPRAIPHRSNVLTQYLLYLLDKRAPLSLLEPVAALAPPSLRYCDYLVWHNQPALATAVWHKLFPHAPAGLTDPAFDQSPLAQGFAWRLTTGIPGIAATQDAGLRFEFSGRQPEHTELLSQFVVLPPGKPHSLTIRYATSSTPDTGLHLRLAGLLPDSAPLPAGSHSETYRFTTPPGPAPALYRLVLSLDRSLGALRFEGTLHVIRIDLVPAS